MGMASLNSAGLARYSGECKSSFNTMSSDSVPFQEKYEMDEEGDLLGEVSF